MFGKKKSKEKKPAIKPGGHTGKKQAKRVSGASAGKEKAPSVKVSKGRTASGKVPQGRTLKTRDDYLSGGKKTGSKKERPVVVIEANERNDLAVVPLSSRKGKDRTQLKKYQQGQSYFKHYVEIEDDEGNPIRVNQKFKENHPNMDVSGEEVEKIKDKVFFHSRPMQGNRKKIDKFRKWK